MPRTRQTKSKPQAAEERDSAENSQAVGSPLHQANCPRTRARAKLEQTASTAATGVTAAIPESCRPVQQSAGGDRLSAKGSRKPESPAAPPKGVEVVEAKSKTRAATQRKSTSTKAREGRLATKTRQGLSVVSGRSPIRHRGRSNKKTNKLPPFNRPLPSQYLREKIEQQRQQEEDSRARIRDRFVHSWLESTIAGSVESLNEAQEGKATPEVTLSYPSEDMERNSSARYTTNETFEMSTARLEPKKEIELTWEKLRIRGAFEDPEDDPMLEKLLSMTLVKLPDPSLAHVLSLIARLQEFIKIANADPEQIRLGHIEDLEYSLGKIKSEMRYSTIIDSYFEVYRRRCSKGNEANFQRTVMMNIFNLVWLDEIFQWNTEGQWILPKDYRLVSTHMDDLSLPKPDLSMSFTFKSFVGKRSVLSPPLSLSRCISPDGSNGCFPFLFVEAKGAAEALEDAELANMHSASQALFNIYNCMYNVKMEDVFFEEVRLFSVSINNEILNVRVHRCEKQDDGNLFFYYIQSHSLPSYTKDQVTSLMDNILTNYAKERLHPILKKMWIRLSEQESESAQTKRKDRELLESSAKRSRNTDRTSTNHTGLETP